MKDKEKNIWPLIVRHLDGDLKGSDANYFEIWLDKSPENRRILHSVDQIWKASETPPQDSFLKDLYLVKDWETIARKIETDSSNIRKTRASKVKKMRQRHKVTSYLIKIAALVLVAFTSGFLTLKYAPMNSETVYEPVFREIRTNPGERANIVLGDGTEVLLNNDSKLVIPDKFSQSERVVSLTGQAFFDVESDKKRPFYIETQNAKVIVLGTAFDVRSYEDEDKIQVAVREGTVELTSESGSDEPLILNEGYVGSLLVDDNNLKIEQPENIGLYFGWMNGRLIFKEKELRDVLKDISRWYDVDIDMRLEDQSVLEHTFTADLKTRSVSDVLNVIAMSMNVNYEIDQETIIIRN